MMDVAKTYQAIEDHIQVYISALTDYEDEQFLSKKAEDIWSLGQMYEHLYKGNLLFLHHVQNCLTAQEGQKGGEKTKEGIGIFHYGSFPPVKIKVPVKWKKKEPVAKSQAEYRTLFQEQLQIIQNLQEQLEKDAGIYKTEHAVFGFLSATEWYQVIEMHLKHHLKQKRELEGGKVTSS